MYLALMKIQSSGRCTIIQSTTLFELVICSSEQPAQSSLMMCGSMIFKLWPLVSHRPSSRAHLIYFPMSFSFLKMLSTSTPSNGNLSRLCVRVATTNTNRTVTASQDFILFRPISSGEGYLNRDDFGESGLQEEMIQTLSWWAFHQIQYRNDLWVCLVILCSLIYCII